MKADPGKSARGLAVRALGRLLRGRGGKPEESIARLDGRNLLSPADRRLLSQLVFGVIRHLRLIDHQLEGRLPRPGDLRPAARNVLRIGVYQLLFLDRIPQRAAVHTSVELARAAGGEGTAGLVNAVLRRVQAEGRREPPGEGAEALALRHSFPDWMVRRWLARFGPAETGELLAAMNAHPPLNLRVNALRATRREAAGALAAEGVETAPCRWSPEGLVVLSERPLEEMASFARGLFSVQDEAFQVAGSLLPVAPGERVLDLFAGLGGKSTHLAQRSGDRAAVVAADLSPGKLLAVFPEAARLGLGGILPVAADAAAPPFPDGSFRSVLLDAPCSATGVIRRHPDIKWNRSEGDLARLAGRQLEYLARAAPLVAPGGRILYATCSLEPEEGEEVVERFLRGSPLFGKADLLRAGAPPDLLTSEGFLRSFPHRHGLDGAFAALLERH